MLKQVWVHHLSATFSHTFVHSLFISITRRAKYEDKQISSTTPPPPSLSCVSSREFFSPSQSLHTLELNLKEKVPINCQRWWKISFFTLNFIMWKLAIDMKRVSSLLAKSFNESFSLICYVKIIELTPLGRYWTSLFIFKWIYYVERLWSINHEMRFISKHKLTNAAFWRLNLFPLSHAHPCISLSHNTT